MDYFNFNGRRRASSVAVPQDNADNANNTNTANPPQPVERRPVPVMPSFESMRAPSTIRIRRLPSSLNTHEVTRPPSAAGSDAASPTAAEAEVAGRRRSFSAPQRYTGESSTSAQADLTRQRTLDNHMPAIREGIAASPAHHPGVGGLQPGAEPRRPVTPSISVTGDDDITSNVDPTAQRSRRLGRIRSHTSATQAAFSTHHHHEGEYTSDVIDLLDLVDPEVRTLGTLTNLQNSLFVPDLGGLVNRRPTYDLTRHDSRPGTQSSEKVGRSRAGTRTSRIGQAPPPLPTIPQGHQAQSQTHLDVPQVVEPSEELTRRASLTSELSDSHYAVLPHGVSLAGWSEEEIEELNDHVRHLLHSRREGFKRSMRGFRKYISKPLGLFVFVYATLVTLFGAAWVFCLIGWIYIGNQQSYFINVIDNVLVALFALIGDGLAPFRAIDTYHMCFIAHYHHLTWRLRREKQLPKLIDKNDLPDRQAQAVELEDAIDREEMAEYSVLSQRQQQRLQYHQAKFNKSHTFYKPHETATHHAFPLKLLVAIVVLLDCHSLFQVALGTCTWSIDYRVRPQALTATILSCSITCNIVAGVIISIGDHKTRKKDVLERMFRQGLTEEALKRMAKKHERGELNIGINPTQVESQDIKDAHQEATGSGTSSRERSQVRDAEKAGQSAGKATA